MNIHQIFSKAANHLLKQGTRAYDCNILICKYRHGDLKCAVGALIDDEHYHEDLEGHPYSTTCVKIALFDSGVDVSSYQISHMLNTLQHMHDGTDHLLWETELERYSKEYNIKWTRDVSV